MDDFLKFLGCILLAVIIAAIIFGIIALGVLTFTYFHEHLEAIKSLNIEVQQFENYITNSIFTAGGSNG